MYSRYLFTSIKSNTLHVVDEWKRGFGGGNAAVTMVPLRALVSYFKGVIP